MTRVDFYVLPVSEPHGRLSFACRLAEKAWLGGHKVYLHGEDDAAARSLDELLWSFQRVAEIVLNDPESLRASRARWSFYKDRGYPLEHHDMQHMRSAGE